VRDYHKDSSKGEWREGDSVATGEYEKLERTTVRFCHHAVAGEPMSRAMFGVRASILGVIAALFAAGCFYPPVTQPPPDERQEAVIALPYDLAWDAVNAVISQNAFHVQAQDMTNGIIEAVGPRFTLHDADCGEIKSVAGRYTAEPELNSSSVYNFLVRPRGPEASIVKVRATFNSSVKVPLHPATDVDCVSHGVQESDLLREVLAQAKKTHRPAFANLPRPAVSPTSAQSSAPATVRNQSRPTSSIDKAEGDVPASMQGFSLNRRPNMPDLPAPPPN